MRAGQGEGPHSVGQRMEQMTYRIRGGPICQHNSLLQLNMSLVKNQAIVVPSRIKTAIKHTIAAKMTAFTVSRECWAAASFGAQVAEAWADPAWLGRVHSQSGVRWTGLELSWRVPEYR